MILFPGWWLLPGVLLNATLMYVIHPGHKLGPPLPSEEPEEGKRITIEGTIVDSAGTLRAPASGEDCVAWHDLILWEGGEQSHRGEAVPFVVQTTHGRLWIELPHGWSSSRHSLEHRYYDRREPGETRVFRGREGRLNIGDPVTIIGIFKQELARTSAFREEIEEGDLLPRWTVSNEGSRPGWMTYGDFRSSVGFLSRGWRGTMLHFGLVYFGGFSLALWLVDFLWLNRPGWLG